MVQRFDELIVWQKSRELTRQIYQTTLKTEFARDFGLRDQIRRASVSIMSNIAEGFERGSPAEFMHFLSIAKGSCGEVRAQLFVALDVSYISQPEFEQLMKLASEIARLLVALRNSINPKHKY